MLARYRSVEWLLAHQLFRIAIALPPTEEIDYDIVICNLLNPVAGLGTNVAGIRDLDFTYNAMQLRLHSVAMLIIPPLSAENEQKSFSSSSASSRQWKLGGKEGLLIILNRISHAIGIGRAQRLVLVSS